MKSRELWILENKTPRTAKSVEEWANYFELPDRLLFLSHLKSGTRVSTVFLGIDHNFSEQGPPILFETMVFGGPMNDTTIRYVTYEEAALGHEQIFKRVYWRELFGSIMKRIIPWKKTR